MSVVAACLLCLTLIVREIQSARAHARTARALEDFRLAQASVKDGTRRLAEDVFVLQNLLLERNLLQQADLLRARGRLIDQPRRKAEERSAMLRQVGAEKVPFVLEDVDGHVH